MKTGETFDGIWWSVQVPNGWRAHADEKCATFHQARSFGAFQISSAQKDTTITDTDLEEFANDRIPEGAELIRVAYSNFSGFTACFQKGDLIWREWWLRADRLMVYATYNVSSDSVHKAIKEQADVEGILATLKPKG